MGLWDLSSLTEDLSRPPAEVQNLNTESSGIPVNNFLMFYLENWFSMCEIRIFIFLIINFSILLCYKHIDSLVAQNDKESACSAEDPV